MQLSPQIERQPAPRPRPRGLIERIGQIGERALFIQGWAVAQWPDAAPVRVGNVGRPLDGRLWTTRFDRPDVAAGAGFVAILELDAALAAPALQALRIGEVQLDRYEQARLLKPDQSLRALRDVVGNRPLSALPAPLAELAARFDGTDTIAGARWPVRIGIDDCVCVADSLLVSGWLYDPEALVASVAIGSANGRTVVSDHWLRSPRPDVDAVMAADPVFSAWSSFSRPHGFMALVPGVTDTDGLHLSLALNDHLPLHAPLAAREGHALRLLRRFLDAIPPDAPTSLDAAEKLVAPILAGLTRPPPPAMLAVEAPFATIVGLHGNGPDCAPLLALLAAEPQARDHPVVIAAERPEIDACRGDLTRAAHGYGLDLRFAPLDDCGDSLDAMLQAAQGMKADRLCLLDFAALPDEAGWLSSLLAQADADQPVVPMVMAAQDRVEDTFSCCLVARTTLAQLPWSTSPAFLTRQARADWLSAALSDIGHPVTVTPTRFTVVPESRAPSEPLLLRADRAAARLRQVV